MRRISDPGVGTIPRRPETRAVGPPWFELSVRVRLPSSMARTNEDLEGYLLKLDRRFERLDDGTYLVAGGPGQPPIAIRPAPPVVVIQVPIGRAPSADSVEAAKLFRHLLELNARELLHAAFAIEAQSIVLGAALEMDNLDVNELEAVLADMDVALAEHVPTLREMVQK